MSCTTETVIACDICGENNGADDRALTAKRIRANRKEQGWVYRAGNDFCPACAEKLKQARKGETAMDDLVSHIVTKAKRGKVNHEIYN